MNSILSYNASDLVNNDLKIIYASNPDLHNIFSITDSGKAIYLLMWWTVFGYKQYPGIKFELNNTQIDALFSHDSLYHLQRIFVLYSNYVKDKLPANNIATDIDYYTSDLLARIIDDTNPYRTYFDLEFVSDTHELGYSTIITKGMYYYWLHRRDVRDLFSLKNNQSIISYWNWWISQDAGIIPDTLISKKEYEYLFTFVSNNGQLYYRIADMVLVMNSQKAKSAPFGKQQLLERNLSENNIRPDLVNCLNDYSYPATKHRNGVNLLGLPFGQLGIGEDIRMAAQSLASVNIRHAANNIIPCQSQQNDRTLEDITISCAPYYHTIVTLPAQEHLSAYAIHGHCLMDNRFTIGYWPWELPYWPDELSPAFDLVDEVWVSSKYTEKSLLSANPDTTVRHMPMAVELGKRSNYSRKDFKIAENAFVFLYLFDGLSYLERKNPIAHINAFKNAFDAESDACLVIKTMNLKKADQDKLKAFVQAASNDDRILIIDEAYSKDKLLGLIDTCDCFVSLHRSEGFGRSIAEAMLLEKPVITSNFSGNTDFCLPETAYLVGGHTISLRPGDYPFASKQQHWFNPDTDQAAYFMNKVYENKDNEPASMASRARKHIETHHNFATVGKNYKNTLVSLGLEI